MTTPLLRECREILQDISAYLDGDLEVERLHQMQVFPEFLRDQSDRDVVDIQLISFYKEEQEIERTLELV